MALVVDGGGLVNKGGALGTGAACCCNKPSCACVTYRLLSKTLTASVTVTIPESEVDCQGGDYSATFTLNWDALLGRYLTCHNVALPGSTYTDPETGDEYTTTNSASFIVTLFCDGDGKYKSTAIFSTYSCGSTSYSCTIGNGGFTTFGSGDTEHGSAEEYGVCYPVTDAHDVTESEYTGCRIRWTITVT